MEWVPVDEVDGLVLHTGFAEAWPALRSVPDRLQLVVGPELGDDPVIERITADGLPRERLPSGVTSGGLHRLMVNVHHVQSAAEAAQLMARCPPEARALALLQSSDLDLIR